MMIVYLFGVVCEVCEGSVVVVVGGVGYEV